nr:hypothetical protein [Tanacetum cinerariifolium]
VKLNQPEPVLVDENEELEEEEEFKDEEEFKEEEPQEAEYVVEVEDKVEPEDETVLNNVHEVGQSSTATFLQEDGDSLLPSFIRRDINSLFDRIASLTRRVCGRDTAYALVKRREGNG